MKKKLTNVEICGIVACDNNRIIGNKGANALLWNSKQDMEFFKRTTMGHTVVMGGSTYRSIGKELPGRKNIIVSRSLEGRNVIRDPQALFDMPADTFASGKIFIIGGCEIYEQYANDIDHWYVSNIPVNVYDPEVTQVMCPIIDPNKFDFTISYFADPVPNKHVDNVMVSEYVRKK